MIFKCNADLKSGIVPELGIDSSRHPAPLLASSRETWVQLADLPKVRCERSVFSAPRQRMSVVEGREVIVINIKKIRQVISELIDLFLPH